ncbi:MAG: lipid A biosynthesis lauroyl acyltransferase [Arenimonas sp.]
MDCLALRPLRWLAQLTARLPQRALLVLSALLLPLAWPWLARRRRIAAANFALCFPELDTGARRRLLRRNMRATLMGALELLRGWYAPSHALRGLAEVEGAAELSRALAQGTGVLLLTSHFTHNEPAIRLLAEAVGVRARPVIRRNNSACLESEFEQARRRHYLPSLDKKDVRGLLRCLLAGEMVAYAGDQDFSYRSEFVPFFGVPAATLVGTPELAARGKARVFVMWCRREPDGRYRLRVEPAWAGWKQASPAEASAMYMRALEAEVRVAPEQYLWVHRRFKTRPPGEPSPYR